MQGSESSDFIMILDFFALHKTPIQTFNALKSTSFQGFPIMSDFFRLLLTDALTPLFMKQSTGDCQIFFLFLWLFPLRVAMQRIIPVYFSLSSTSPPPPPSVQPPPYPPSQLSGYLLLNIPFFLLPGNSIPSTFSLCTPYPSLSQLLPNFAVELSYLYCPPSH